MSLQCRFFKKKNPQIECCDSMFLKYYPSDRIPFLSLLQAKLRLRPFGCDINSGRKPMKSSRHSVCNMSLVPGRLEKDLRNSCLILIAYYFQSFYNNLGYFQFLSKAPIKNVNLLFSPEWWGGGESGMGGGVKMLWKVLKCWLLLSGSQQRIRRHC